jgi:carboxymethylenebutenolidase
MGGRYACLCATRIPQIGPVVSYYGGGIVPSTRYPRTKKRPVPPIERLSRVRGPMLFFFGGEDELISRRSVLDLRSRLKASGRKDWTIRVYPGAGHGFHCDDRSSYHPASARDAWARTLAFLRRELQ